MKIFITIISILFGICTNAQNVVASELSLVSQTDSLLLKHDIGFSFGAGPNCPELSNYIVTVAQDTLVVDLYYDISGAWQLLGCGRTTYFNVAIPDSNICWLTGNVHPYHQYNEVSDTIFYEHFSSELLCPLSVNELRNNHINVFPNPVRDILQIESEHSIQVMEWQIINVAGEIILWSSHNSDIIDLSQVPPGMYLVNIITN